MEKLIENFINNKLFITILVFFGTLVAKDLLSNFASNFAAGLAFYFDKNFNEGDHILIDKEHATIVKIGITKTVLFMIETHNWKFISNNRIRFYSLEKENSLKRFTKHKNQLKDPPDKL